MTTPYNDRETWDRYVDESRIEEIHDRTGDTYEQIYENHLEAVVETELFYGIHEDDWDDFQHDYIEAMINSELDREEFFDRWDIDPADFPWDDWREAMGYNG